jgi:hypothetical protein
MSPPDREGAMAERAARVTVLVAAFEVQLADVRAANRMLRESFAAVDHAATAAVAQVCV